MKFLQRASNAVSAAASGLLAPGKKKSGKAVAGARRRQYAPELPPEVLHAIFLPLAGDMRTLCAAACVNTSWHTAALHPRLWRKLHADRDGKLVAKTMTDARLAMLVRRACGVDAGGKQHKLVSLRVTHATVSLRGVLAALRGPRGDHGDPLLRESMRTLRVAGLPFPARGTNKLIEGLFDFLRPSRWVPHGEDLRNLDLRGGMTPCTHELDVGEVCGRAASTRKNWCQQCNHALCGRCRTINEAACEDACSRCGNCRGEMFSCASNEDSRYCICCMDSCCGQCDDRDIDGGYCKDCAKGGWTWCDSGRNSCQRVFCDLDDCLKSLKWCEGESCTRHYCWSCDYLLDEVCGEEDEEEEPRLLCQFCRGVVQPAAEHLRWQLRNGFKFDYCSASEGDYETEED